MLCFVLPLFCVDINIDTDTMAIRVTSWLVESLRIFLVGLSTSPNSSLFVRLSHGHL